MRWHREKFINLLTFGEVERPMFVELFGPLIGLEDEWQEQGASKEELDLTAFCWEYVDITRSVVNCGMRGGHEPALLEETEEHIIERDAWGRTTKLCKGKATIALPLDYPVKNMDDWMKMKTCFTFTPERVNIDAIAPAMQERDGGAVAQIVIPGGFDLPRQLLGEEELCLAFYEQPELVHDILQTAGDTVVKCLGCLTGKFTLDMLSVAEDLAGKSGSLVGPKQIDEFIAPYYQRCWEAAQDLGAQVFGQDSDGNLNSVIDAFLDAGLTRMYPMEPAAGMDIVKVREKYGQRLSLNGGIDKHVLRQGKEEIRRELEYKMQPLMRQGGTIFGLDHRIPNGTPLENYRYYVKTGREILGLPPLEESEPGWARMAM